MILILLWQLATWCGLSFPMLILGSGLYFQNWISCRWYIELLLLAANPILGLDLDLGFRLVFAYQLLETLDVICFMLTLGWLLYRRLT